jgi:hypothetical protein
MRLLYLLSLTLAATAALAQMPQGGPPQAAISACDGQREGANCSFSAPRGEVSGACRNTSAGMACAPTGGPPGAHGSQGQMSMQGADGRSNDGQRRGPPAAAIGACSGQSEGASCAFTAPLGEVTGSCRNTRGGLACVPAGGRGGGRMGANHMGDMQ